MCRRLNLCVAAGSTMWAPDRVPITELDPTSPHETYGLSKVMCEQMAQMAGAVSQGKMKVHSQPLINMQQMLTFSCLVVTSPAD